MCHVSYWLYSRSLPGETALDLSLHSSQSPANTDINIVLLDGEKQQLEGIVRDGIGCLLDQVGACTAGFLHV